MNPDDHAPEGGPAGAVQWTPTRAAGLQRLEAFAPFAGGAYARGRNVDRGPQDRSNVSALSPWIRRRLITEQEVIAAVLRRHRFVAAEKFIQEVFWRSYWKGWLEMRPGVLTRFDAERLAWKARAAEDASLRARLEAAMHGATGIACFDAWVEELRTQGWLHNHARMWFASIWIFTLKLPWPLGADFMFKTLLDADAASNTLSWRWVAGLHTRGKAYVARAQNIADNTLQRFDPRGQLDERAVPLVEDAPPMPSAPLPAPQAQRDNRIALLLHEDDLHPESWALRGVVAGVAGLSITPVGDPEGPPARFARGALEDALARAAAHFSAPAETIAADAVGAWATACGVREIVTGYAPMGLAARALDALEPALAREGVRLTRLRRGFDSRAWPHASAGFFKFRERIPALIAARDQP
ncbi:MAG: FAD-binding domain-containing protein [Hyphomonadaceae bacterium]|nr:FAD-binding domain-containing protein [Hyphomonadaceae bacterium]